MGNWMFWRIGNYRMRQGRTGMASKSRACPQLSLALPKHQAWYTNLYKERSPKVIRGVSIGWAILNKGLRDQPGKFRRSLGTLVCYEIFMSRGERDSNIFWGVNRENSALKPRVGCNPQGWS